jgi:hypothetical protein
MNTQPRQNLATLNYLQEIAQQADTTIKTLDAEHARLDRQTCKDKMDTLLEQQPKKGHKAIFGSAEPRQELTTVTDPDTGCPTSDTARVQQVLETHCLQESAQSTNWLQAWQIPTRGGPTQLPMAKWGQRGH